MSQAWGTPPWRVEAPLVPGPLPERCEVAVVGGGFCGLATALELAQCGADVVLLEADAIGAGASGRSGGLALEDTAIGPLPGLSSCLDTLERCLNRHDIDCELQLGGCWELTHDTRAPLWSDEGKALSIADEVPGGSLNPGLLCSGLARAAVDAGAQLFAHTPVSSIHNGALRVGNTTLRAETVCVALNAYLPQVAKLEGFSRALTLAWLSEPLPSEALDAIGLPLGRVFYTADTPYLWGRRLDNRLLIGSGVVEDAQPERINISTGAAHEHFVRIEARVRGLHPALNAVRGERRWGGPIAWRVARAPILDRVSQRIVVTGGFSGHGVALSFATAKWITEHLNENRVLPDWGRCPELAL